MTDHRREVHRSKTSKGAFLLSKTDIHAKTDAPDESPVSDLPVKEKFPDALDKHALIEAAMKLLAPANAFGAIVVRIDDLGKIAAPEAVIQDTADVLDTECRKSGGLWGIIDRHVFACFLPGFNEPRCQTAAESIRRQLADTRKETVSFGIAVYPTIVYGKEDIFDNAVKALDHAEFFGPASCVAFDSVSLNISGDTYYQDGDIDKAMEEYNLALTLDPENINVHNSIGVCHGVKGDLDMALGAFRIALRLDSNEKLALYNAGYIHLLKGAYSTALEFFERAGRQDENIFELNFQTGRALLELDRPLEAVKHLERAITLNDKSGITHRYLGDCYTVLDRTADAASAYQNALKLRPDDAAAISSLGYTYEIQQQNAEIALMFCQKATEMEPGNGLFHHRLGRIYFNRNLLEEALAEFETAMECGHNSAEYIQKTRILLTETNEKQRIHHS